MLKPALKIAIGTSPEGEKPGSPEESIESGEGLCPTCKQSMPSEEAAPEAAEGGLPPELEAKISEMLKKNI